MSLPSYLSRPIAARLIGCSETRLTELADAGHLRRFGGHHAWFSLADVERLRGRPIDVADLEFAEHQHERRKLAYRKQNEKRQHALA